MSDMTPKWMYHCFELMPSFRRVRGGRWDGLWVAEGHGVTTYAMSDLDAGYKWGVAYSEFRQLSPECWPAHLRLVDGEEPPAPKEQ